jgi:hypothetical protein
MNYLLKNYKSLVAYMFFPTIVVDEEVGGFTSIMLKFNFIDSIL